MVTVGSGEDSRDTKESCLSRYSSRSGRPVTLKPPGRENDELPWPAWGLRHHFFSGSLLPTDWVSPKLPPANLSLPVSTQQKPLPLWRVFSCPAPPDSVNAISALSPGPPASRRPSAVCTCGSDATHLEFLVVPSGLG